MKEGGSPAGREDEHVFIWQPPICCLFLQFLCRTPLGKRLFEPTDSP